MTPAHTLCQLTKFGGGAARDDAEDILAAANFQMGLYLHLRGRAEAASAYLDEAKRLAPRNWGYARQAWNLEDTLKAGGPEFWAAVQSLGGERYYPEIDIEGMPADPVPSVLTDPRLTP